MYFYSVLMHMYQTLCTLHYTVILTPIYGNCAHSFVFLCLRLKRRQEEGCMVGEGEGAEGEAEGEGDPDREGEEAEGGTEDEETEPEPETSKLSMCGSVCSSPGSS